MKQMPAALVLLAALSASAEVKNPGTLIHVSRLDPQSLDPAFANDSFSLGILGNCYETLLDYDERGRLIPRLAVAVPSRRNGGISADGRTYSFRLRGDAVFADGAPATAEDARYSILRQMLLDPPGGTADQLLLPVLGRHTARGRDGRLDPEAVREAFDAVSVVKGRLVVRLKRPFAPFPFVIARTGMVISAAAARAAGDWDGQPPGPWPEGAPVKGEAALTERTLGTGSYRVTRWDKALRTVYLEAQPGRRGSPALARVVVKTVPEAATRRLMLEAGDADMISPSPVLTDQLDGAAGVRVTRGFPASSVTGLYFNVRISTTANRLVGSGELDGEGVPPDFFADRDVRAGFARAFDVEAYRQALKGEATRSGFLFEGMSGYDAALMAPAYDLEAAAAHLRRAHGGRLWEKGFFLRLSKTPGEAVDAAFSILRDRLAKINPRFRVELIPSDWPADLENFQLHRLPLSWRGNAATMMDPHALLEPSLHSRGYFGGPIGAANPEIDRLLDEAVVLSDAGARARAYRRVQELAWRDLIVVPLVRPLRPRIERTWLRGWTPRPMFWSFPEGADYSTLEKKEN